MKCNTNFNNIWIVILSHTSAAEVDTTPILYLAERHSMRDLSSPTRDQTTRAFHSGSTVLFKFLFLFGCTESLLPGELSLVAGSRALRRVGATLPFGALASYCGGLLLLQTTGSRCTSFNSYGAWA